MDMINKPQDTENILSAIKDMMGESSAVDGEPLPKDVLELTESIQKNANFNKNENEDVLELTQLISENESVTQLDKKTKDNIRKNIDDAQLREMIRDGINNQVSSKIDLIIEQEIEKIIKDKLQKTEIIIKSEDSNQ